MENVWVFKSYSYLSLFFFGLILGGFLNVVIYHFSRGESSRFYCYCQKKLRILDLFPVVSYPFLRRRCRHCISLRYPCVELAAALITVAAFINNAFSPQFFYNLFIYYLLIIISFIDVEKSIIPDRLVLLLLLWILVWQLINPVIPLLNALAGLLAGGGLFYLIAVLSKGAMGGGDIKLMAVLGLASGWPMVLVVFLLSFLLGAAVGLVLIFAGKKKRNDALPFGPFLVLAFIITKFWGLEIWHCYVLYM